MQKRQHFFFQIRKMYMQKKVENIISKHHAKKVEMQKKVGGVSV